ncbi:DUF4430 domain-containing protein [Clostridium sp. P21]|uniref:DUF4430 domain-containing protein n=1 Tax=Clostridium muellerianum TaxID=2716538 RepID=A0A7Y0HPV1_9CLOT|nr:DUF4430 domain-containing protein [Clostridium muellerianum]NMM63406.1 DUF4430 domain-containing protein [Clostridium muellerianum]
MNKNKKKYVIAASAFVICFLLFILAVRVQRMYAANVTNEQSTSQKKQSNTTKSEAKKSIDVKNEKENKKEDKKAEDSSTKAAAAKNKESSNTQTSTTANISGASSSSESNTQANSEVKPSAAENIKVKPSDPDEQYSFQFIDTVNGNNVFLKKNVDNMEGDTVGYITEKLLDEAKISFKATGSASTIYFAAINGLEEKKAGKLSGWCYYVRKKGENEFEKPNVGSGQWIYHKGDIIVWKYLADGIHDGYSDDWMK